MEHTHLVKGLDYALLEKVCTLGLFFSVLSYSAESGPVSCRGHDCAGQESFVMHKNILWRCLPGVNVNGSIKS